MRQLYSESCCRFEKQQGILNEDNTTYVKPDISVICDSGKVNGRRCTGVPDWVIEVLSPGSRRMGIADLKTFRVAFSAVPCYDEKNQKGAFYI